MFGDSDHVVPVLVVPVTVALKSAVCPAERLTEVGDRLTPTVGDNDTVPDAVLVESAALIAVTVTVCAVVMVDGAV
jgi:hypothetical protein